MTNLQFQRTHTFPWLGKCAFLQASPSSSPLQCCQNKVLVKVQNRAMRFESFHDFFDLVLKELLFCSWGESMHVFTTKVISVRLLFKVIICAYKGSCSCRKFSNPFFCQDSCSVKIPCHKIYEIHSTFLLPHWRSPHKWLCLCPSVLNPLACKLAMKYWCEYHLHTKLGTQKLYRCFLFPPSWSQNSCPSSLLMTMIQHSDQSQHLSFHWVYSMTCLSLCFVLCPLVLCILTDQSTLAPIRLREEVLLHYHTILHWHRLSRASDWLHELLQVPSEHSMGDWTQQLCLIPPTMQMPTHAGFVAHSLVHARGCRENHSCVSLKLRLKATMDLGHQVQIPYFDDRLSAM